MRHKTRLGRCILLEVKQADTRLPGDSPQQVAQITRRAPTGKPGQPFTIGLQTDEPSSPCVMDPGKYALHALMRCGKQGE